MPAAIRNFEDFREYSLWYLRDTGLDVPELLENTYRVVLGPSRGEEIPFGDFAGRQKWRAPAEFPPGEWNGRTYDRIVAHLADVQGDTEFGSNEQQVGLWETAPSDYDRKILMSVIKEEFRHGWQMGWTLTEVLGTEEALRSAQTLLERRSGRRGNARLLSAFNEPIDDWLGFYCFLEFMDRDGGSQLSLLQDCAIAPLGRSMTFMLREEAKHLRSGEQGFERILSAGRIPVELVQKYVNLYAPLGYDLHGGERSTNALIYWRLGLKGFHPLAAGGLDGPARGLLDPELFEDLAYRQARPADFSYQFLDLRLDGAACDLNKELLNGVTVSAYRATLARHFERFNEIIRRTYPPGTPELVLPSLRWNRSAPSIYAGERHDIRGNEIPDAGEYEEYRRANLPTDADRERLRALFREEGCIAPPETDVYKDVTRPRPSDDIFFETAFGGRPSRFICALSSGDAASAAAGAPPPAAPADEPLWAFLEREEGK